MNSSNPAQGSPAAATPAPANGHHRSLTDDEILGIAPNGANARAVSRGTAVSTSSALANTSSRVDSSAANRADANRGSVGRLGSGVAEDPFADDAAPTGDASADSEASVDDSSISSSDPSDSTADTDASGQAETPTEPEQFRAIFQENPQLRDAWCDAQTFHELFPNAEDAREIHKMFPNADAAHAAGQQLSDLAKLDTLFFSNRPESHAELAATVYRLNPAAFRNLASVMNAIASSGSATPASTSRATSTNGATLESTSGATPTAAQQSPPETSSNANDSPHSGPTPEHAAFFHDTNAATVQGVFDAIHSQVDRLLPEGTSAAARQRLVAEIYREVDSSLRANPAFGQQLRQAFRGAGATPENQRAIVGMVVGRARQALPGITKKVTNEWTSAIIARSNARSDRQRAAEKRVDIASGAAGNDGHRALMPRDIDYRRMSDADILNM